MIRDTWTVARKEWREVFMPCGSLWGGAWSEGLIVVGALGIFIALQIGPSWVTSEVALYWLWLPLLQMTGMIAESIAGERERRTLETLLASRLDDRAILFGKLLAALAYGWGPPCSASDSAPQRSALSMVRVISCRIHSRLA